MPADDGETLDDDAQTPGQTGRFVLGELLGRGATGRVYRGTDRWTGEEVAVKVIVARSELVRERVAREVAALRIANVPGVVRLLGHGVDGDSVWIGMERVSGQPFGPGSWESLAGPTLLLVETLSRVHALGIIHRDLKPANVLVSNGRPIVLDFGLARGERLGDTLTAVGVGLGTPRYQAPEQASGKKVSDRVDIYALGVMLYEALAGRPPHLADDLMSLQAARALMSPLPLEVLVPSVPPLIAGLVRRMLARTPEDRPSADELLRVLSGKAPAYSLPYLDLGSGVLVDQVVTRLHAGLAVDLGGPSRSGRTSVVDRVAQRFLASYRTIPSERPFGSLLPLGAVPVGSASLGILPAGVTAGRSAEAWFRARLDALDGPVLADDWEQIDPWSQALLLEPVPRGVLRVRESTDALRTTPASLSALCRLFLDDRESVAGAPPRTDRIFHLAEDAGALLLRRTGGWEGRVADQLQRWIRQGRVAYVEGEFRVDRATLDELGMERLELPPLTGAVVGHRLGSEREDLLIAAELAWPHATIDALVGVLRRPAWELELQIRRMVDAGLLIAEGEGWRPNVVVASDWSRDRRREAHARVADTLPLGAEARLAHLLRAGEAAPLVEDLWARARNLLEMGQDRRVIALLWQLRELAPGATEADVLLVRLLLQERTVGALEQARFVASRQPSLHALVEVVQAGWNGDVARAEAAFGAFPADADPESTALALGGRFEAARGLPLDQQAVLLDVLSRHPVVNGGEAARSRWQNWNGILLFRQGRFAEAAAVHERAAEHRPTLRGRLNSLLNAARAHLEAGAPESAARRAQEVERLAARHRLPNLEAQAIWLLRVVANQHGSVEPDLELPSLVEQLGDPVLTGQVAITEGFIAWRGGHPSAGEVADRAAAAFRDAGITQGWAHADALRWAHVRDGDPGRIVEALLGCGHARPALDGLGLIAGAGGRLSGVPERLAALLATHGAMSAPSPHGALVPAEALRLIQTRLELP